MRRRLLALAALALGCGSGSGDGLVVLQVRIDGRCTPLAGSFPSGFALVPGLPNRAAVVQFAPPALVAFDLDPDAPRV